MGDELYPTPPTRVEVWASKIIILRLMNLLHIRVGYIHSDQTFHFVHTAEQKLQRRVIECFNMKHDYHN